MQGRLKILKLIDNGDYTEKDIISKLKSKTFTTHEIKCQIQELKREGEIYISDSGYAKITAPSPPQYHFKKDAS
jgi:SOS response regulatory protein OraA/RecX